MEIIMGLGLEGLVAQLVNPNMTLQIGEKGVRVRRDLPICLIKNSWIGRKGVCVTNVEARFILSINAQRSNFGS